MRRPTENQVDILRYVREGMTNQQIADQLGVSKRTIDNTMSRILVNMDADDRMEAVQQAESAGYLEPGAD